MRQITTALADMQKVRSPRAWVTVTVEERGQNPTVPALAWSELVGNVGQSVFRPTALVGLANGTILKFVAMPTEIRKYTITNPHLAASWTGASFVVVVAVGSATIAALRGPGSSLVRLFYQISSGNILLIDSANNGSTWGGATTVYSGGDAVLDLCVAYNSSAANGPWFFGFTTQTLGVYTPRFGYWDGAAWVTHAYGVDSGWRAAGIDAYGASATAHRCLVVRQRTLGASKLRCLDKLGSAYTNSRDIDHTQAGLFGLELAYYRFCQLPPPDGSGQAAGCMLAVVGESAYGAGIHLGVGGIFTPALSVVGGSTDVLADEPLIFPEIAGVSSQPYAGLCSVPSSVGAGGTDVYLAGDTVVWRGAAQTATGDTLEPNQYRYDDHTLEIEFRPAPNQGEGAGIATIYVGQILVVTRTLSWGAQSGSEALRAIIVRVEQGTDKVRVVALDALGWLGTARCRRPSILNDGTVAGVARVMRKLAARFGVVVGSDNSALETAAVMPFTLAPSESLRGAAFRVGSQAEYYLVPANDGSFALTMITPGDSDSGDYDDTPHDYGVSPSQQPIAQAAVVSDYRTLAFSYILGTRSTDPQDGGALAMAAGSVIDNTRPMSYSLTNSRYNTTARVQNAAAAEGARHRHLPITGLIEGQANLALELYDMVEVTEALLGWNARSFRVRRIVEEWDRGRLTQTVYLGDE